MPPSGQLDRRLQPAAGAAIGTGPYRVVSVQGKERIFLERFDAYWGKRPDWEHVEFRVLPNDSARVAALLAGDVDLIEFVPLQDAARLNATPGFVVHSGDSARVMFLGTQPRPESDGARRQEPDARPERAPGGLAGAEPRGPGPQHPAATGASPPRSAFQE